MIMYLSILLHIVVLIFSLACLSRLVGALLGWFLSAVTKNRVQIGHVTLWGINDVVIVTHDSSLHIRIKHISIVSKFFSSSMRLFGVFVGEVDVKVPELGDIISLRMKHSVTLADVPGNTPKKPFKLPLFIIYLIQRLHFSIESIKLHVFDGDISISSFLSTGANLVSFSDNDNRFVSSHFAMDHIEIKIKDGKTTFLNTSFGIKLNLLLSCHFESVESINVSVDMLSVMVYEGIIDILKQLVARNKASSNSIASVTRQREPLLTRLSRILPKIPKYRSVTVKKVCCSISDIEESRNMSFNIEHFTEEGAHDEGSITENVTLNNLRVYINNTAFLSVSSVKITPLKVAGLGGDNVNMNISTHIDVPVIQWFNTEIITWLTTLPLPSEGGEVGSSNVSSPTLNVSSVIRVTNLVVKLYEDNKALRKLITLTLPSFDYHHHKTVDKLSIGVACKKLQLELPLKIKKRLQDKIDVIRAAANNHLWGQVLDIKSLTLKVQRFGDTLKIDTDMQNAILEWNYHFSNLIMELMPQFIIMLPKSRSGTASVAAVAHKPRLIEVDSKVVQLNMFLLANDPGEVCSLVHINKLSVIKKQTCSSVVLENCYVHLLERLPEIYLCNIDLDQSDTLLSISRLQMSYSGCSLSGYISNITVYWEPTQHRVLETCVSKTKGSLVCIRDLLMYQRVSQPSNPAPSSPYIQCIDVDVNRSILNFATSPSNHVTVQLTACVVKLEEHLIKVRVADNVAVIMDTHRIIEISDVVVEQVYNDSELLKVRESYPDFTSTNKAWYFQADQFKIFLPHNYGGNPANSNHPNIALAIDEAQNCFKMFKGLHRAPRLASDGEPLYADCRIEIKLFLIEFEDYEFDQKISQNYMIMQHIARKLVGHRPPEQLNTEQTLLLNLSELADNSYPTSSSFWQNYYTFQRGYKAETADLEPVKLATILLSDMSMRVCADESLNGHDNVVDMINKLDDGTSVPADLRFNTLWGRALLGGCSVFCITLRDFPSQLWTMNDVLLKGILCGAEPVSPNHAIRKTKVMLRKPWKNFELARGMNSIKYFYDLSLDASEMVMSWGPCLEPSYQFFGQCLDKVTKKSRDPSPLLPFWDKMRSFFRGTLALRSETFCLKLLSEREPLNHSEYLSICSKDFLFKWTNGRLIFDGDTVIKNNTESKYGECQIVTLPRLSVDIHMKWKTPNNMPNDHWSVVPYDPKFVKLRDGEDRWDSYRNFRSLWLDMDISLNFSKVEDEDESENYPKVNVYSHTFKWLDSWVSVMARTVSRPVFKGPIWKNFKPPKKKLTRHYRKITFRTEFDEAELEIWSSYRKKAGAKLTVDSGKLHMTHKLTIVDWPPTELFNDLGEGYDTVILKRRPRTVWSTESCSARFHGIQGILKGSLDSMSDNEFESSGERSPEHFLFSIGEVEYRQRGDKSASSESLNSTNSRDSKLYTHWISISDVKASINIDTRTLILAFLEQYESSRALKRDMSAEALRIIHLESGARRSPRGAVTVFERSPNQSNDELLSLFDEDFVTVVTSDEKSNSSREQLAGEQGCSDTDIKNRQWSIQMTNGQIALQGPELNGFIILTTGQCKVLGSEHMPVLRGGEFFSKFSWVCIVEHVQYFATVDEAPECHIPWLDESIISARRCRNNSTNDPDRLSSDSLFNDIEEQEESLKGIVREVYKHDTKQCATQLQRIVSRCGCLISFVTFGSQPIEDFHTSTEDLQYTTQTSYSSELLSALSLRHKSLEVATNSHQYKMIIDCLNNLIFRTEGSKRSSKARLQHAIKLMVDGEEEAKKTIGNYQQDVRKALARIRELERQLYDLISVQNSAEKNRAKKALVSEKQKLTNKRVQLRLTISAFKDHIANKNKDATYNKSDMEDQVEVRKNDICIDDANWTLTGECGQIPIMEVTIRESFNYSRTVFSTTCSSDTDQNLDFSSGHKISLGYFCVKNLQNDRNPQNVLFPMNDNSDGADGRNRNNRLCLRVYLSQQHNPVGGIIINHHLEINLVPLVLRFETVFWREIQKFFVGEVRAEDDGIPDYDDLDDSSSINPLNFELRASKRERRFKGFGSRKNIRNLGTNPQKALDEMSERSKKRFFNFVKIQQFPILISYKGKITVNEKTVLFPEIEIKERTQTWKELVLEIKKISVPKVALSLGKLKHTYAPPIPGLSSIGLGNNSNVDEGLRDQEVYRFLTGSDADAPAKKKTVLGSLRRKKNKKSTTIPARPNHTPSEPLVKECDIPGEWEENSLGERINELAAMSSEPLTPSTEEDTDNNENSQNIRNQLG